MSLIEPSPQTTLVILLGASEWPLLSTFQSSPAFKSSANKVRDYFCHSRLFGLPPENWLDLFDQQQDNPNAVDQTIGNFLSQRISQLKQAGTPARDLLFYYIGHGTFDSEQAYHLAIGSTRNDNISASAVPMVSLAHTLKTKARHLRRIVILDCCFAAKAFKYMQSAPDQVALLQTASAFEEKSKGSGFPKRGTALLCSSGHKTPSLILPDESGTMFSEAFIRALTFQNIQQQNKTHLSLHDLKYPIAHMLEILVGESAPRPEFHSPDQSDGDVADIPFFPDLHLIKKETFNQYPSSTTTIPDGAIVISQLEKPALSPPFAQPPIPVANINPTIRSDEKEDDGLLLWDNRKGQYVIQLATHPAKKLERDPSFKKLLPGTYHFAYLNEKSVLIRAEPIYNASLLASYCSIAPLGTTHEEQALHLHQKALCEVFQFDLDDLMVNRQRSLSDKQVQRLSKKRKLKSVGAIMGIFVLIGFFLFLSIYWRLHDLDLIVPWLFIISFILFLGFYARNQTKSIDDLQSTHIEVKREEGRIVRTSHYEPPKNNGGSGRYIYKYRIGKLTFRSSDSVSDQHLNNVLFSEINYGIFYIKLKADLYPQVVSIEPLEVPKQ